MNAIGDIIRGREPVTLLETQTALEAADLLAKHHIGALPVVNGERRVVGIFSERDLMARVVAARLDPAATRIETVMSRGLITASPSESPAEALTKMKTAGIRHLLVVTDNHQLAGIISLRDLMEVDLNQKAESIRFLHEYIFMSPPIQPPEGGDKE